jgi:hypothetical protein
MADQRDLGDEHQVYEESFLGADFPTGDEGWRWLQQDCAAAMALNQPKRFWRSVWKGIYACSLPRQTIHYLMTIDQLYIYMVCSGSQAFGWVGSFGLLGTKSTLLRSFESIM